MPFFKCKNIKIAGIACAVPEQQVSVDSFAPQFGEDVIRKFKALTGVEAFRKTHDKQTASDLGCIAAEHLLVEKNIDRSTIGAVIFVSHSPDYRRPATACVLHKRLGLHKECCAYDISLGCSAYIYGLQTVASIMQCSDINRALLICAESVTKLANPKDRATAMLFGDCGSASLLEKTDTEHTISGIVRTDGTGYRAIMAPAGGFRNLDATKESMIWPDGNERSLHNIHMDGAAVFNFTLTDVPRIIKDFLARSKTSIDDYDSFILHQANLFILKQIARKLKIPLENVPISLDRYGNTSAAAIPLTLCDAFSSTPEETRLRVIMCGFGVGLSWGVAAATLSTDDLFPVLVTNEYFAEGLIERPEDMRNDQ